MRQFGKTAWDGLVGNAAWAVVVFVVLVAAPFLKGSIPAWVFIVSLVIVGAAAACVASAERSRSDKNAGALDEARKHEAAAMERLADAEREADVKTRELREQLVAASGGQTAVSTKMQSIARQVDALASTPGQTSNPTNNQIVLLVALLEDFQDKTGTDDPIVSRLLDVWRDSDYGHSKSAWDSALSVLHARALSIGAEEAIAMPES